MPPVKIFLVICLALTLFRQSSPFFNDKWGFTCTFGCIFAVQCVLWIFYTCLAFPKLFSPLRHLPSPKEGNLFLGHTFRTGYTGGNTSRPIRQWIDEVPNSGIIRYLDVFNQERIVLTSPQALAEVLSHRTYEFTKPRQFVKTLARLLGIGLFLAEGKEHRTQRKNLMPAFAFGHIKALYPAFWAKSMELVECLVDEISGVSNLDISIDVQDWASRVTLDIIGVTGFGQDFHALQNSKSEVLHAYKELFTPSRTRQIVQFLALFFPLWLLRNLPINRNNILQNSFKTIQGTCSNLVQRAKKTWNDEEVEKNILSVALKSGAFSDDQLVNQLKTFLLAGYETTSSSFAWAICMLCKYPEVQARLCAEVQSLLPDCRDPMSTPTAKDIDNLPYLSAFCNEVFRLWPPVAIAKRVPTNDTTILGHHIPKDTLILIVPWAINVSKVLWGDDAREFKPERWMRPGTAGTGGAESNYAFLTFLQGPRSCIGQSFAKGELACLVAAWVSAFETRFADDKYEIEVDHAITVKPRNLNVRIKIRQA